MTTEAEQWRFRAAVYSAAQGHKKPLLELLRDGWPLMLTHEDKLVLADHLAGKLTSKRAPAEGRPREKLYSHTWYLRHAVDRVRQLQQREGMKRHAAIELVLIGTKLQGKDLNKRRGEIVQALSRGKKKSGDKKSRTK